MTASTTTLYVHGPQADPLWTFALALDAIGAPDGTACTRQQPDRHGRIHLYTNDMDGNLLAALQLTSHAHGPLRTRANGVPAHHHRLAIATHYDPHGPGSHRLLHAQILAEITAGLADRPWSYTDADGTFHGPENAPGDLHGALYALRHLRRVWPEAIMDRTAPTGPVLRGRILAHHDRHLGTLAQWADHPTVTAAVQALAADEALCGAQGTDRPAGTGYLVEPAPGGGVSVVHLEDGKAVHSGRVDAPNPLALYRMALARRGWAAQVYADRVEATPPRTGRARHATGYAAARM